MQIEVISTPTIFTRSQIVDLVCHARIEVSRANTSHDDSYIKYKNYLSTRNKLLVAARTTEDETQRRELESSLLSVADKMVQARNRSINLMRWYLTKLEELQELELKYCITHKDYKMRMTSIIEGDSN